MAYTSGIKTISVTDDQMAMIFEMLHNPEHARNYWALPNNSYAIFKMPDNAIVGPFLWINDHLEKVKYHCFNSQHFGEIKPKDGDKYQIAYMDSIFRNELTFCTGPGGSGKSQIALAYAFQELEKTSRGLDRIVIFANVLVAKNASRLGYYPGSREDKLLDSSIGSILISKIGSRDEVQRLIDQEQLILMPLGDARGYETAERSFVYFSEAQNTNKYLIKLFLQRIGDNCKTVVEGDIRQTDADVFENGLGGMQAAISTFLGEDYAGHVELQNIYRSKIAKKAEEI